MDNKTEAEYLKHFCELVEAHPELYTLENLITPIKLYGITHFGEAPEFNEAKGLAEKIIGEVGLKIKLTPENTSLSST
jgi:hypothetical protein